MKIIIALVTTILFLSEQGFSQCEKSLTWTASKAEFLDDSGGVQDTKDVKVTIQTHGKRIKITHYDDETDTLAGPITDLQCAWKDPYKNGKTTMKADLSERGGVHNGTLVTIEGIDSKIIVRLQVEGNDGRKMSIRIPIDSYKED